MDVNKIIEDVLGQHEKFENSYGEPQAWIGLDNGRSIEITEERELLRKEDYFYSCRLHCTEEEFENNKFHSTMGVVEIHSTNKLSRDELEWCLKQILSCNKIVK